MSRVFFTDRDLGKRFPEILRAAGLTVERHSDHFAHDCRDEKWLETVGRKGWVAITHDGRIRYKPNELAAVMAHRVALLVVIGHAPYPQLAQAFVASIERVLAFLDHHTPPFVAKVYRASSTELATNPQTPGRVELWHPADAIKPRD